MHQTIAYAISCWLLFVLLITSATSNNIGFLKRNEERNINLLGKEVVNHIYTGESGNMCVNEKECMDSITRLPCSNNVVGMIFVYDMYIIGVSRHGEIFNIEYDNVSDFEKITYINRMVNRIFIGRDKAAKIEIASKEVDDSFFNSIGSGVTVFLLSDNGVSLSVSGFTIA